MDRCIAFIVLIVLAASSWAAPAHGATCRKPVDAEELASDDGVTTAWARDGRVIVCRAGRRRVGPSARRVTQADVVGNRLALVRRKAGCVTVAVTGLRGAGGYRQRLDCAARVTRVVVVAGGTAAVNVRRHGVNLIVEVGRHGLRRLARRVRPGVLRRLDHGYVSWFLPGVRHDEAALLGRRGCSAPASASVIRGSGLVATMESFDDTGEEGVVTWCDLRRGVTRFVRFTQDYGSDGSTGEVLDLRSGRLLLQETSFDHYGGNSETASVLRLGRRTRPTVGAGCGTCDIRQAYMTPAGGVLIAYRFRTFDGTSGTAAVVLGGAYDGNRLKPGRVLDQGTGVDPASLQLTGATASWMTDGQPRTATVG